MEAGDQVTVQNLRWLLPTLVRDTEFGRPPLAQVMVWSLS